MNLIIVESPTKARTLSRFLGKDFSVVATMGHIKDLPKSKLGVDVEKNFNPDYVVVEKRGKEIEKLGKEAKKATNIYIATDPDREGEAIAQHVEELLDKNLKFSRIVFHEITKGAVEDAIQKPRNIDKNLVVHKLDVGFWTDLWAINYLHCFGKRYEEACQPGGFNLSW